jgi:HSP20 family protein
MKNSKDDLFGEFSVMAYEMNKLVGQILKAKTPPRMSCQQQWAPPADVYETADEIIVCLEVPGIKLKELSVKVEDKVLRVRGRRPDRCKRPKVNYYLMEIHYGDFEKTVLLPGTASDRKIKTVYQDGFIEIKLPKTKSQKNSP